MGQVRESAKLGAVSNAGDDTLEHSIISFAAIAVAVVIMPGADTVLVLRMSLREDARAGITTAAGVVCGPIVWGTLAGLGVALLVSQNPLLYNAVAAAGGLYLGYLACRAFASAGYSWGTSKETIEEDHPVGTRTGAATYFFTGLMTNLLNPKIGVFYLSVMPGLFLGQQLTAWLGALLGLIHAVLGLIFLTGICVLSGFARCYVSHPWAQAVIELICGLCLLGFGIYVLVGAVAHSGLF